MHQLARIQDGAFDIAYPATVTDLVNRRAAFRQPLEQTVIWLRPRCNGPNSAPVVAMANRQLHTISINGDALVLEVLDRDNGETHAVYSIGTSERYNPIMLALELLPNGDPVYPAFGGVVHLRIGPGVDPGLCAPR